MKLKEQFSLVKIAALAGLTAGLAILGVRVAVATGAVNFKGTLLSSVFFESIRIHGHSGDGDGDADDAGALRVGIDVRDPADVSVTSINVKPQGNSGWHSHPGPSIVSVVSGTATVYDGDDPTCTPKTYAAGTGFVDQGFGHVHLVRNVGIVDLNLVSFQIKPHGVMGRDDAPDPGFCPGL